MFVSPVWINLQLMPNPTALAVVTAAVGLTRTHLHAPALDVLDIVMRGRTGQMLDFTDPTARHGRTEKREVPLVPKRTSLDRSCKDFNA